jgi:hypothetical protein
VDRVGRYCSTGRLGVQGWLSRAACQMVTTIDRVQSALGIKGNVAEIGVHHGRLFVLLTLLCREGEQGLAIDLFDDQERNVDGSGKGHEQALRANLAKHAPNKPYQVHAGDSTLLSGEEVRRLAGGPVRIFSVDGGHTEEITRCDLLTAQASIVPEGVIILDDCFNDGWPGVVSGVASYMALPESELVPFATGANKTLFCRPEFVSTYTKALKALPARQADGHFFGRAITSLDFNKASVYLWFRQTKFWKTIKDTAAGERARQAYDKVSSMVR